MRHFFRQLAKTGEVDDIIRERYQQLEDGTATNRSITLLENAQDIPARLQQQREADRIAERNQSVQETANNSRIGATSEEVDLDEEAEA